MIKEREKHGFYYSKVNESNLLSMILFNKFQNFSRELIFVNHAFPEDSQSQQFSNVDKICKI